MTYIKVVKIDKSIPRRTDGFVDRRFGKREKSIIIPPETKIIDKNQLELKLDDDNSLL